MSVIEKRLYVDPTLFVCLFMNVISSIHSGYSSTILSNVHNTFPMLTAILSGKSEGIYDQLFQMIIHFAVENGLLINPKISITDFEKASTNNMRRAFPDVKTFGQFPFGTHSVSANAEDEIWRR
jgi:hypothetical protein